MGWTGTGHPIVIEHNNNCRRIWQFLDLLGPNRTTGWHHDWRPGDNYGNDGDDANLCNGHQKSSTVCQPDIPFSASRMGSRRITESDGRWDDQRSDPKYSCLISMVSIIHYHWDFPVQKTVRLIF